jgi:DNA repair exonuclease SbcCD nuclease subunit
MFKFLHTADIHLDSPLLNLDSYDGAPVESFRSATRRALDNLIGLAIEQEVEFVLIAGDLYDGECRDFNTPIRFRQSMEALHEHGIRVFIIQGNHDAASKVTKAFKLQLPENVHVFRADEPETKHIDELNVSIHGQGFARPAVDIDLSDGYPAPTPNRWNIGMLHTSCGAYEEHGRYAPSSLKGLTGKGYDYWALGHIHKKSILAGPRPFIVYPGNVQGRHIREQGEKGCFVVTVEDDHTQLDFHPLDVLRWRHLQVDCSSCSEWSSILAEAERAVEDSLDKAAGRPLAIRIEFTGETSAHRALQRHTVHWDRELRESVIDRFDEEVWIEKVKFRTRAKAETKVQDETLDGLLASLQDETTYAAISEVDDELRTFVKQLPTDPRLEDSMINLDSDGVMEELLNEARDLLISRLTDGESA